MVLAGGLKHLHSENRRMRACHRGGVREQSNRLRHCNDSRIHTNASAIAVVRDREPAHSGDRAGRALEPRPPSPARIRSMAHAWPCVMDAHRGDCHALRGVRQQLKRAGAPLPANDVWIAALARQHDLPVLSRDAHFDAVPTLTRLSW